MKYISKSNSIPAAYQDELEDLFLSNNVSWDIIHEEYKDGSCAMALSHMALNDGLVSPKGSTASDIAPILLPISYVMEELLNKKISKLLRVRVGLLQPVQRSFNKYDFLQYVYGGDDPHIDFQIPHYTGLYYVNDSDGDTVVFNETFNNEFTPDTFTEMARSTPEKGKIFIFNGDHYHKSSRPTSSYARVVIAFSFTVRNNNV